MEQRSKELAYCGHIPYVYILNAYKIEGAKFYRQNVLTRKRPVAVYFYILVKVT